MRSDFMDDNRDGFRLIEFNGIAAGMGPFGQRIHDLHHYLQRQYPAVFSDLSNQATGALVDNQAIEGLSAAICQATCRIKQEF
ncbi:glutathione synthase, partial [Escherichia coli]|nr:glutathione synthase [Escherichia coli]